MTALSILQQRDEHEQVVQNARPREARNALRLPDAIYETPYMSPKGAGERRKVSQPTSNDLLSTFRELGFVLEITGQRWGQIFTYEPYLALLRKGTEPPEEDLDRAEAESFRVGFQIWTRLLGLAWHRALYNLWHRSRK